MSEESRNRTRLDVCLAVELGSTERPQRVGLSRNVSASGVLVGSFSRFEVGTDVTVTFLVPGEADERRTVTGRVVRYQPGKLTDTWPHVMAVRFAEEVDWLAPEEEGGELQRPEELAISQTRG